MRHTAIMFPGQGAQYSGMADALYSQYSIARDVFNYAKEELGFDVYDLCRSNPETLANSEDLQIAIFTTSIAAYAAFSSESRLIPSVLIGHSLGEITALVCANAFKFSDALHFIRKRSKLMSSKNVPSGRMVAIMGLALSDLNHLCQDCCIGDGVVEVSNYNSEAQIVVSGHSKAIDTLLDYVTKLGGYFLPLQTSGPYHSSLMEPLCDELMRDLEKYTLTAPQIPVLSCETLSYYKNSDDIRSGLSKQIVHPVKWTYAIKNLVESGIYNFIDLGPQAVLRNLMLPDQKDWRVYSYCEINDRNNYRQAN